ncbi:MAG: DNA-3-methyladenine glycosylase, partial [Akkermansiaceae bacterium]|nr:DNA-3-methyladenine glycosylase [Akkermansiaceae bacterium]
IEQMQERRRKVRITDLCSGPGKLTQALGISGADHEIDFLTSGGRGIFHGERPPVVAGPRIGINRGQEFPWRFTEAGSIFISR